jgi:putative SOS response-associated peptidase YedK
MCGRYVTPEIAALEREYELHGFVWPTETQLANYNVAPTDPVPVLRVVRDRDGALEGAVVRWGLIPAWARGAPKGHTINARIETLKTNGTYKGAWQAGQRCLVPIAGFYEWQAQPPDYKDTVPFYITVVDQPTFALAGLWDVSVASDGKRIESCTVITMQANALMRDIHNSQKREGRRTLLDPKERRMPAILNRNDQDVWLRGTPDEAFEVLKPYPSELMLAVPVSSKVNSVKNNGPELIVPVDAIPRQVDLLS